MKKICSIVGARPQFVKAAALSRELRKSFREILVHTGQHYDDAMSSVFFRELEIPEPDRNLGIGSGSHGFQTGRMLAAIEEVLEEESPDLVLVYGDTNSTLAGSLAAAKLHIPVGHVEAGLRSFNREMPEEINRVLADEVSALLFCPTETAVGNLRREGIVKGVNLTGDVMLDILLRCRRRAAGKADILARFGLECGSYYLLTIHRAGNTDDPERMNAILGALEGADLPVIFPAHPRTAAALVKSGRKPGPNIRPVPPCGYLEMLLLEENAARILTDSGGVQKEAYLLGVPCVTLREETEWVETLERGWNVLAGADPERIAQALRLPKPPAPPEPVFGDGQAAAAIVEIIKSYMG